MSHAPRRVKKVDCDYPEFYSIMGDILVNFIIYSYIHEYSEHELNSIKRRWEEFPHPRVLYKGINFKTIQSNLINVDEQIGIPMTVKIIWM